MSHSVHRGGNSPGAKPGPSRAAASPGTGPINLLNAIRTAAAPDTCGKGALVVMNDEISGARDVTKSNTCGVDEFRPGEFGFLGHVGADKVAFYRATTKWHTAGSEFDVSGISNLPKAEVLHSYVEAGTAAIKALTQADVDGIVFAGTGAGGHPSSTRSWS